MEGKGSLIGSKRVSATWGSVWSQIPDLGRSLLGPWALSPGLPQHHSTLPADDGVQGVFGCTGMAQGHSAFGQVVLHRKMMVEGSGRMQGDSSSFLLLLQCPGAGDTGAVVWGDILVL